MLILMEKYENIYRKRLEKNHVQENYLKLKKASTYIDITRKLGKVQKGLEMGIESKKKTRFKDENKRGRE